MLSERGAAYLEKARALGPALDEAAVEIERIRDITDDVFSRLVEGDFFRLVLPREYGGAELSPPELACLMEEFARHDASTAWCLCQNNVCATVSAYLEPDAAARVFDSPRAILAWGPGPGQAHAVDGGYRLSGSFNFASGSRHATWLGCHVPVIEPDGTRRPAADGSQTVHTLLFPRASADVRDTWQVMGLKGTGSDSFSVEDVFVPQDLAVPRNNLQPRRVRGRLYVFSASNLYSSGFAGLALGVARATLDSFVATMRDTVPRGAARSRGANNVVQATVGREEARLRAARMHLLGTLEGIWHEADGEAPGLPLDDQVSIRLATTWAIQQSREVVSAIYMAAGAVAIFESGPFERRFRDIHTVSQQIQGHAAHFETVGQILMGMEPDRSMFSF